MAQSTTSARKNAWNTYAVRGYTHQVGTDHRACGGAHLHQVKRLPSTWAVRVVDSNGRFRSAGPARPVSAAEGECLFERAAG